MSIDTQAYLFVGPAGSNKTQAAYALAQALMCPKGPRGPRGGSCGACDRCGRILRRKHPDVRYFAPAGANGYLLTTVMNELVNSKAFTADALETGGAVGGQNLALDIVTQRLLPREQIAHTF